MFVLDLITFFTFFTFPMFAPIHRALGFLDTSKSYKRKSCQRRGKVQGKEMQARIQLLLDDRGTHQAINLTTFCVLLYTVGDVMEFTATFSTFWQGFVYVILVLLSISVFYGGILIVVLSMRAILTRLYKLDSEVQEALQLTDPQSLSFEPRDQAIGEEEERLSLTMQNQPATRNDGILMDEYSDRDDEEDQRLALAVFQPNPTVQEWTQRYWVIRNDVHNFSKAFGVVMLTGMFLFLCESTSLVGMLWEDLGSKLGFHGTAALLLAYVPNAVMISAGFHNMAYLVMACSHRIGPNLVVLANRCQDQDSSRRYQVLASAFLHAPVKISIGIFEVGPEYASTITLFFIGLFLVVFGLKMPGEV
eukprot:CAMPEP_0172443878 /NCGR_PEP_ID=MMETSP1065-20121228/4065_1 /TAXON_ID=265537 /ORGANISM="Amphiprora paludosa, Strain CCMP125" /LENGTH=361 /DNA_ID=CAMNT_0013194259 /DNA_START=261 /DNA_END=1346 /DNA_ORIENTATION=-